jgi:hypothetical protein
MWDVPVMPGPGLEQGRPRGRRTWRGMRRAATFELTLLRPTAWSELRLITRGGAFDRSSTHDVET